MKKIFFVMFYLIIFGIGQVVFAENEVLVDFNGVRVEFDQPAIISGNRTMVPMRKIFELLGAEVDWDNDTRTARAKKHNREVSITIGSDELYVNGDVVKLDVPARIVNDRTLVPLRAVSEAYECSVEWNENERLVEIYNLVFINSAKKVYDNGKGIEFEYFWDCNISEQGEDVVIVSSGACSLSITVEEAYDVAVDDEYAEIIRTGLEEKFPDMRIEDIKNIKEKNIIFIKCYNKGKKILYVYWNTGGQAHNLALTVPDGALREDEEKLMYIMNGFKEAVVNWM